MMKNPDFFILGAPKCGTTSMDAWLGAHPSIYMATKEPHYFNMDHQNRLITELSDYQTLFTAASDQHHAVGETSVRYLYSQVAVANILKYNAQAKFIVMLRNPIDMVYSWHSQVCFSGLEDVRDFSCAWELQQSRLDGHDIPHKCGEVKMLFYGQLCCLGAQLERLYQKINRERVHCIFFDDLSNDARQTYQRVLTFLGVEDDHRTQFMLHNPAKTYRSHSLNKVLPWLGKLKTRLGIKQRFGLLEFIRRSNIVVKKRPPMTRQMRQTLIDYFSNDVHLLAQLSNRDLSHWLMNDGTD